jgi:uncharacterized membrane protein YeaQ/YmgE (transglycosylase-associated protein family)
MRYRLPAAPCTSRASARQTGLDLTGFSTRIAPSGLFFNGAVAMTILAVLVIGAIAGWLAGLIVRGAGFGLIGNIVIGIVGALVASWLLPRLGVSLGGSAFRDIVNATIGAVIVLVILSLVRRA